MKVGAIPCGCHLKQRIFLGQPGGIASITIKPGIVSNLTYAEFLLSEQDHV